MICISISQESRRMALADMLNAGRQCDLLELRLDRFDKAPDLGEFLANKPKPIIMSCKRPQDGGTWQGTEDERLTLLRQCIVSKADYVEIELDVADKIRPFPPAQRIISYTNLEETPEDIQAIYDEALLKKPDIVKLTTLARTPEEAWPLVQIVARAHVPTVVVGLGNLGVMLSLLGKKIGAPFTFAALEPGMEAYEGQVTVHDLNDIYAYGEFKRSTRLVAVTGFSPREQILVAVLNQIFRKLQLPHRCLPMAIGSLPLFRKLISAVKLGGVVVDPEHQSEILEIQPELHGPAKKVQAADLLLEKDDVWHAFYTAYSTWVDALIRVMRGSDGPENPLKDRIVMVVGLTPLAAKIVREVQRHGGGAIVASHQRKAGQLFVQDLNCRFLFHDALYTTMHDVLVICENEKTPTGAGLHPGYLKHGMTVMDLTAGAKRSTLLDEAKARGCKIVEPMDLLLEQIHAIGKQLTGKDLPREWITQAVPERYLDE